jgi:hypothetical protein
LRLNSLKRMCSTSCRIAKSLNTPDQTLPTKRQKRIVTSAPTACRERATETGNGELGSYADMLTRGSVLLDADGKPVRAVGAIMDISARRAVDRMKNEFISVVSHELRTPLTSIRGSLGLLAGGLSESLPDTGKRMLQIAVTNTDRLYGSSTTFWILSGPTLATYVCRSRAVRLGS